MNGEFKDKLISMRKEASISQRELGEVLNVSDRAISKWENGISYPSTQNLIAIARFFDKDLQEICGLKGVSRDNNPQTVLGMESLKELYKVGRGPSSSHTIGPERVCKHFIKKYPDADLYEVVLYGSLAKTGKGHGTDTVIKKTLYPTPVKISFNFTETDLPHPNTLDITVFKKGKIAEKCRVCSIGGGKYEIVGEPPRKTDYIYRLTSFKEIEEYCFNKNMRLYGYVEETEGAEIRRYMEKIWEAMKESIRRGICTEGILPGSLKVRRKAKHLFLSEHIDEMPETRENRLISAYAFAVSEENANGETVVTAPTCGAAGVLPAVLYYEQQKKNYPDERIVDALMTAGIIGNLIKTNASISGAECGCQAEIGTACAMASAALGELFGLSSDKIEYAAEISIEHHLGLTCDPICGYVQIPCIERNAVAAMRAVNAVNIASFLSGTRKVSFDSVVAVMKKTGLDISGKYKETSEAGLATIKL